MDYSVVATTFNDSATIESYLKNICAQSLKPTEIVIADGGSKDKTVDIINAFAKKNNVNICVISGRRLNIAEGYNEAIKAAKCDWIGITGIGNSYDSDYFLYLSKHIDFCDVLYSPIRGIENNGFNRVYNNTFLNGRLGNDIGMPSNHGALIKKEIFLDNGLFYEKFIYAGEDAEFYKVLKTKGIEMKVVPEAKVYWHIPDNFKDYIKQVKNYTIGDMQIFNNSMLKKKCIKHIAVVGLYFLALFVSLLLGEKWLVTLAALSMLTLLVLKLKNMKKSIGLILVSKILPCFFIIKFKKYLSEEYKVKR